MQQLGWKGLIGDPGLLIALLGEMLAFSCFPFFFFFFLFSNGDFFRVERLVLTVERGWFEGFLALG